MSTPMGRIWTRRIIGRTQQYSSCPASLKDEVLQNLKDEVAAGNPDCTAEIFKELTGVKYTA